MSGPRLPPCGPMNETCRGCGAVLHAPSDMGYLVCRACDRKAAADQLAREHERLVKARGVIWEIARAIGFARPEGCYRDGDLLDAVRALKARAEAAERELAIMRQAPDEQTIQGLRETLAVQVECENAAVARAEAAEKRVSSPEAATRSLAAGELAAEKERDKWYTAANERLAQVEATEKDSALWKAALVSAQDLLATARQEADRERTAKEAAEKERDEMCASRADAIMEKHAERAAKEEALAALAAAPHDPECVRWMALGRVDGEIAACRCWKSRAPGREEAAALRALVAWRHDGAPGSSGDFRNRELQEAAAALVATNRWR